MTRCPGCEKGEERRLQLGHLDLSAYCPAPHLVGGLRRGAGPQLLAVSTGQPRPGQSQPQVLREGGSQATAGRWEDTLFPQAGDGLSIVVLKLHRQNVSSLGWPISNFLYIYTNGMCFRVEFFLFTTMFVQALCFLHCVINKPITSIDNLFIHAILRDI